MTCDSCGAEIVEALPVHRAYLPPTGHDEIVDGPTRRVLTETEQWCYACRTQYPHDDV